MENDSVFGEGIEGGAEALEARAQSVTFATHNGRHSCGLASVSRIDASMTTEGSRAPLCRNNLIGLDSRAGAQTDQANGLS